MAINQIQPNISQLHFTKFGSAAYLIKLQNQNILIDTSSKDNQEELIDNLKELNLTPEDINIILITHAHYDHIGNLNLFNNARIYDSNNIDQLPKELNLQVHKVPGHTKDSLAFLYDSVLFSGDTLFKNGIGRTDLPESQPEKMQESLKKLESLNYKVLCPGHV